MSQQHNLSPSSRSRAKTSTTVASQPSQLHLLGLIVVGDQSTASPTLLCFTSSLSKKLPHALLVVLRSHYRLASPSRWTLPLSTPSSATSLSFRSSPPHSPHFKINRQVSSPTLTSTSFTTTCGSLIDLLANCNVILVGLTFKSLILFLNPNAWRSKSILW